MLEIRGLIVAVFASSLIALNGTNVSATTSVTSGPVQGAVITRVDLGQSFLVPTNGDALLQKFTVLCRAVNFDTFQPTTTNVQFNLFAFDGSSVVGAALYRSSVVTLLPTLDLSALTFTPMVALEPGGQYIAVYRRSEINIDDLAGIRFDANTLNGVSDVYPQGSYRTAGFNPYPYAGIVWEQPGTSGQKGDLNFTAVFDVPEPTMSAAAIAISGVAVLSRKRQRRLRLSCLERHRSSRPKCQRSTELKVRVTLI